MEESENEVATKPSTSTLLNHTIPPFYACYLLRSLKPKRAAIYIGSTPDPPRRIKQHNGLITGGAFKTKRGRPWEMELIVYGFPSKLQALQFEWAWQNPHASRHLHSPTTPSTTDKPTAQFPKTPLSNRPTTKVQVLQFMLTRPPWKDFNLRIMIFSELGQGWWNEARILGPIVRTDVAKRKYLKERASQGSSAKDAWRVAEVALDGVDVLSRYEGVDGGRMERSGNVESDPGVKLVVNDDDFFLPYWQKWTNLIALESSPRCHFCSTSIEITNHLTFVLCVTSTCSQISHITCLATHFLSTPPLAIAPDSITPLLPSEGNCPTCREKIHWQDLIRGSYRRWEESGGGERKRKSRIVVPKVPKAKAASKRKGKAVVEESSEEEEELRELDDDDEAERSWAQIAAAEGAIADVGKEGTDSESEEDDELRYKPSQPAPRTQSTSAKLSFAVSKPTTAKSKPKPVKVKVAPVKRTARGPTRPTPPPAYDDEDEDLPSVDQLLREHKAKIGTSKSRAEKVYLEISD